MTLVNRTWGSAPSVQYNQVTFEQNAVNGQTIALGVFQTLPLTVDASGLNILQTSSLAFLATQVSAGTSANCKAINYSFNYSGDPIIITDFVMQIVVEPTNSSYPVNAANIMNALATTYLSYLVTAPAGTFNSVGYIAGSPIKPPEPEIVLTPLDAALKAEGYGTLDADGNVLEINNYWRQQANPYWQKGFAVHWEDYFSPKDKFIFSPLPNNPMSLEGGVLGLLLFAMWKKSPSTFERVSVKYLDSIAKICASITQHTKTNPMASVHGTTVLATVLHKIGLVDDGGYEKIVDESRNMITVFQDLAKAGLVIEGVQTLVEGSTATSTSGKYGLSTSKKGLGLLANVKGIES